MSFLKKILKNPNVDDQIQKTASGFAALSQEEIDAHLGIDRYGDFVLTDAIRPSYELEVVPQAGYRWDYYDDKSTGVRIPVLIASASREDLFDLFLDLLGPLGHEVDVVLETSHASMGDEHRDHHRERIEVPILVSTLYDFEELLTHDGCAGIAVLNPRLPMEVQLDEHKLLVMYGRDLERMEAILMNHGLQRDDRMKFITEAEHVHSSTEEFQQQFENLCYQLALDDVCVVQRNLFRSRNEATNEFRVTTRRYARTVILFLESERRATVRPCRQFDHLPAVNLSLE